MATLQQQQQQPPGVIPSSASSLVESPYWTVLLAGEPKLLAHLFEPEQPLNNSNSNAPTPATNNAISSIVSTTDGSTAAPPADLQYAANPDDVKASYFPRLIPSNSCWKKPVL